jgi:hypothetical protein
MVVKSCREKLVSLEEDHCVALEKCRMFLETRPINKFLLTIGVTRDSVIALGIPDRKSGPAEFVIECLSKHQLGRYTYLNFFMNEVFPLLEGNFKVIAPMSFVYCLQAFGWLCRCIRPLMECDLDDIGTYEASLDVATESIFRKYGIEETSPRHVFLVKTWKSIMKNGAVCDELAVEVYRHFGVKTKFVSEIQPILARFNEACACLSIDPSWGLVRRLAQLFGRCDGDGAEARLAARMPVYAARLKSVSGAHRYVIECDGSWEGMTATLL